MTNNVPAPSSGLPPSLLERAALDPNFDLEKFERLVAMDVEQKRRHDTERFNTSFSAACAEIAPIAADANNPQTKRNYATYGAVDRALRPIYTKHGFGVSFSTKPSAKPDHIIAVGYLIHDGSVIRDYEIEIPIETRGAKGTEYTTRTFATLAAASYGNRKLLMSMFGISVDDEPGTRAPPRDPPAQQGARPQARKFELIDPQTGEVITKPTAIAVLREDYKKWGTDLVGALNNLAQSSDEQEQWIKLNADMWEYVDGLKVAWWEAFRRAIGEAKNRFVDHG